IPLVFFTVIAALAVAVFGWLLPAVGLTSSWALALIKLLFVIFTFVMPIASVLTWMERKQSAMMQDRVGPNRANLRLFGRDLRAFGLVHFFADVLKMAFKEDFVPAKANRFLFTLAPLLALAPVF